MRMGTTWPLSGRHFRVRDYWAALARPNSMVAVAGRATRKGAPTSATTDRRSDDPVRHLGCELGAGEKQRRPSAIPDGSQREAAG